MILLILDKNCDRHYNPAMETLITDPAWMEPMLPEETNRELEDIAFELTAKASSLAAQKKKWRPRGRF
jgi:hypothetical protein